MNTTLNQEELNGQSPSFDMKNIQDIVRLVTTENEETIKKIITSSIKQIIDEIKLEDTEILFLFRATGMIDDFDSDRIYSSCVSKDKSKNILLIINSSGGRIEPAYLISKCCKEYTEKKFIVSIPRRAKSAATLISLGADEIHMGSLSEIGPIDPQMQGLPALSLSSALECLASLCKKYPESSQMFAEYLARTLSLNMLGYFERISESAEHYAIRLLQDKENFKNKANEVAHKLVYEYKNHAFVIDKNEALELLGSEIVKIDTLEYRLGDQIYRLLENVNFIYRICKNKQFNLIGSSEDLYTTDLQRQY